METSCFLAFFVALATGAVVALLPAEADWQKDGIDDNANTSGAASITSKKYSLGDFKREPPGNFEKSYNQLRRQMQRRAKREFSR
jgi:hypothetical protein